MIYAILFLFFMVALLSLFEDYLGKYSNLIYCLIGLILIVTAGFREVGVDPDSMTYENLFLHYDDSTTVYQIDYSYLLFSELLGKIYNNVHSVFLLYAILGVSLKFIAFRRNSQSALLPVLIYISFYYIFHECTQIRAGVASGFFLLALKPIADGKKLKALGLILCGTFFHMSGLALIPLIFLNNRPSSVSQRWRWLILIGAGYVVYLGGLAMTVLLSSDIPYIGDKLAIYQESIDKGINTTAAYPLGPIQIFTVLLYLYNMFFYDTLKEVNPRFPLMMKIFSIGLFVYPTFAFFPVIAVRLSQLYDVVNIILFANIAFTFKQRWAGVAAVTSVGTIYIIYSMLYVFQP